MCHSIAIANANATTITTITITATSINCRRVVVVVAVVVQQPMMNWCWPKLSKKPKGNTVTAKMEAKENVEEAKSTHFIAQCEYN